MANLIKLRYSHAYKCNLFIKTGQISPIFLEDSQFELNPHQRKTLLQSTPLQNAVVTGNSTLDFTGEIFTYEDSQGNGKSFTYEASSPEIYTEMLLLTEKFEKFIKNMENELQPDKQNEHSTQEKILSNRVKYLNNPQNCKSLDWINPTYFDDETIEYYNKIKGTTVSKS